MMLNYYYQEYLFSHCYTEVKIISSWNFQMIFSNDQIKSSIPTYMIKHHLVQEKVYGWVEQLQCWNTSFRELWYEIALKFLIKICNFLKQILCPFSCAWTLSPNTLDGNITPQGTKWLQKIKSFSIASIKKNSKWPALYSATIYFKH